MRPVGLGANLVFTGVIFKISFMLVWLVTACGVSDTGFYAEQGVFWPGSEHYLMPRETGYASCMIFAMLPMHTQSAASSE